MYLLKKFKPVLLIVATFGLIIALSGCEDDGTRNDKKATDKQLQQYQKVQPIPFHDWSQYRETLISIDEAQAQGTTTTSFFFLMGVERPIKVCPSVGYPVPSTAQLTSPDQKVDSHESVISQMEPTGVYTGDSTGTYVVCVIDGKAVPTYWEGEVHTEGGPASWDDDQKMIVNSGKPSVTVSTE